MELLLNFINLNIRILDVFLPVLGYKCLSCRQIVAKKRVKDLIGAFGIRGCDGDQMLQWVCAAEAVSGLPRSMRGLQG